jgi:hypothetical protein
VIAGLGVAAAAVLFVLPPIRQGPRWYSWPDQRTILGVPYFWNVVSNLPFAVVGAIGLASVRRWPGPLQAPAAALFAASVLIAFGSAWYHAAPSAQTLLLDRLPMTIAFAAVFALALADRVDPRLGARWLGPLVAIAIGSALFWYATGDLRPYAFVQGYPMLAIPLLLILFPGRHLDGSKFALAVLLYLSAKLLERFDGEIYQAGQLMGGHALKHVVAAWAIWCLYRMGQPGRAAG